MPISTTGQVKLKNNQKVKKTGSDSSSWWKPYMWFSLFALLGSVIYWALLTSRLNIQNPDTISSPGIFSGSSYTTLGVSTDHTYLIKWPFYLFIELFHYSYWSYAFVTVLLSLITVGVMAYFIYRLEKRPVVLGIIYLGLASILFMIPAQLLGSTESTINFANLGSRNIEYALFLVCILLASKVRKLFSVKSLVLFTLLVLLFSSDLLFAIISILGSLVLLSVLVLLKKWPLLSRVNNWLIITLASLLMSGVVIAVLASLLPIYRPSGGLAYISIPASIGVVFKNIGYGFMGLFTNFGVNPLYSLPSKPSSFLVGSMYIPYLVNLLILAAVVFGSYISVKNLVRLKRGVLTDEHYSSLLLIFSAAASLIYFVFTTHSSYPQSNLLVMAFVALFVAFVFGLKKRVFVNSVYLVSGVLLIISISLGIVSAHATYNKQQELTGLQRSTNQSILSLLKVQGSKYLLGSYNDIYPIVGLGGGVQPMVIDGCSNLSNVKNRVVGADRFAILVDYTTSGCSWSNVSKSFGRADSSLLLSGTYSNPSKLLLVYSHGAHKPVSPKKSFSGLNNESIKGGLNVLSNNNCGGSTVVNVVAHEDDDLLFINPDVDKDIQAGKCVVSIYLTAGDSGTSKYYWAERQLGSEAAYAKMLGIDAKEPWVNRVLAVQQKEYITVASPKNHPRVVLIFFNLPDGNVDGSGFPKDLNQSLKKLEDGRLDNINSVDGQSTYSLAQLKSSILSIFEVYNPSIVRTQDFKTTIPFDHSDHIAVGYLTSLVVDEYDQKKGLDSSNLPVFYYMGYQIRGMKENLSTEQSDIKKSIFESYISYDNKTCASESVCVSNSDYGAYLLRRYYVN